MKRRHLLILGFLALLGVVALGFVPLQRPITPADKESAVSDALFAVLENRRVLTGHSYSRLQDASQLKKKTHLYFRNELGIPDTLFLERGLKPIPHGQKIHLDAGDAVLWFSYRDVQGNTSGNIKFAYIFGTIGAHGYEIRIRKSLFKRYFIYLHQWAS